MNAISLANVSYSVSGLDILKRLNLDIPDKCFFAIAGVNGAGKSTLIKLVLDLIRPTDGSEVKIFDRPNQVAECREQIAYLPEKFDVRKSVSGWRYLEFIASVYRLPLNKSAACALAEKLDFRVDRLNSRIESYSKGMVQKLGLLSCFILDKPLLILDEPLSGLDPKARYHFKQLLLEEKSKGRTILYSTHLLADAEEICDQFGILHDGQMKFVGSPHHCLEVYDAQNLEQAYMNCISTQ